MKKLKKVTQKDEKIDKKNKQRKKYTKILRERQKEGIKHTEIKNE